MQQETELASRTSCFDSHLFFSRMSHAMHWQMFTTTHSGVRTLHSSSLLFLPLLLLFTRISSFSHPVMDNSADTMKQFKEFILNYNKLTDQCFSDCIFDFTSRSILAKEDTCSTNCVEKYLKMNQRISQRFQEFQMLASEKAGVTPTGS